MCEEIIKVMNNVHEAKEAIAINDMLGLKTAEEYKLLLEELQKLVDEYIMLYTKKEKYMTEINFGSTYRIPITQAGVNAAKKAKLK